MSVSYTKAMAVDSITAKVVSTSQSCNDSVVSTVHVASPGPSHRGVTCYPNPVGDMLYLEAGVGIETVVITNLLGEVVIRESYVGRQQVSISTERLVPGLYFVRVNGIYADKFLKQ